MFSTLRKMLQAKVLRNSQTNSSYSLKNLGIEFDSLLLGMMTALGFELTETQIFQNLRTLLKQLQLPRVIGLGSKLRSNLAFLESNGLIIRQKGGYIISQKGKPLGIRALEYFRCNIIN